MDSGSTHWHFFRWPSRLGMALALLGLPGAPSVALARRAPPDRLPSMANPAFREQRAAVLFQQATEARQRARQWADSQGIPMRTEINGKVLLLVDYTPEGGPLFLETHNANAGISTAANLVRASPYNLTGTNLLAGIWDGGNVRDTHTEFNGRVSNSNSAALDGHATHVAGTMIARGASSSAIGMATQARLDAYYFDNDLAEMTLRAMATPGESGKIQISNHSYGFLSGWASGSTQRWYGTWTAGVRESDFFGPYSTTDRDRDQLLYSAPYYLPFVSAGNDRGNDAPSAGVNFEYWSNNAWRVKTYDPATDPFSDGWWLGGHDTIPFGSTAKNLMLVGAVNDAVTSGSRDITKATMSTFSSWGPTDDGRLKPDIVANGVSLTSSISSGDTDYGISSGTSMSAPNASGSAILLLQRFAQLFPGEYMRASSIKALILHTADDLHTAGPDYQTGWGLMNTKAAADHLALYADDTNTPRFVEDWVSTTNTVVQYQSHWDATHPIKATLVWTDPPGIARSGLNNTNLALRNNLDLRVISPNGTTNFPWILDPFNPTHAATTGDNFRDNVEQVYLANPGVEGLYTFQISYSGSLSNNMQVFSLMISGIETQADPASQLRLEGDLAFGEVEVNETAQRILTLHNDHDSTVNITQLSFPTGFSAAWTGAVAAGASRDVAISFSPAAPGSFGGNVEISLAESTLTASKAISGTGAFLRFLSITNPPGDISVSNEISTFTLQGAAGAELSGLLTWTNAETAGGGTVAAQTNWQVASLALQEGTNTLTVSGQHQAAGGTWAADSAADSAYSGGWSSGTDGGSGFNGWLLSTTGNNAGHFIATTSGNPSLDIGDSAWGLWANSGDQANANRPLERPLQPGDTLRLAFDNNSILTSSTVGIGLLNAEGEYLFEFFFTGGGSTYEINDSIAPRSTSVAYTSNGMNLAFTLTGASNYQFTAGATTLSGTLANRADKQITRFRAWNHSAGSGDSHNFYLNDLQITNAPGASASTSATVRIVRLRLPPSAPMLNVEQTNVVSVLAEWTTPPGATGYVLAAHTDPGFVDAMPGSGGFEDFSQMGSSSSAYETRVWTNSGIVWTGYFARTDQTISGPAIGLSNSAGYFVSQPIPGGVDSLSIAHTRSSGPPTTFDLFVNDAKVAANVSMGTTVATQSITGIGVTGPFILTVTNNGNNLAVFDNLSWSNPPVVGGAHVPGFSNRAVSGTSLSVTGLTASTPYYLRVRAVNDAGESAWSDTVAVTTLAKTVATVFLDALSRVYDGQAKSALVSTDPPGLNTVVTYEGSPSAPVDVGLYAVTAMVSEVEFDGSATGTLSIAAPTNLFRDWLADEWVLDPDLFEPDADSDGDGMTNWQEFLAGTDPSDPNHVLLLISSSNETGVVHFQFPASSNRFYVLDRATNLLHGLATTNLGWGIPPTMIYSNSNPGAWFGNIRALLEDPDWP